MPVMVPVVAWLLATAVIVLLSYLAARKRRRRLLNNIPTVRFFFGCVVSGFFVLFCFVLTDASLPPRYLLLLHLVLYMYRLPAP